MSEESAAMKEPEKSGELAEKVGEVALRTSLSQAVKHAVTTATGNPVLGEALGQATNTGYGLIPGKVKVGAGAGGILCVHMGTHAIAAGTAGSMAYGGAVLAAFLPFVAWGAAIGGGLWAVNKIAKNL